MWNQVAEVIMTKTIQTIQSILDKYMPRIDLDPTKPMILAGCTKSDHDKMMKNVSDINSLLASSGLKMNSPEFKKLFLDKCIKSFNGKINPKLVIDVVDAIFEQWNKDRYDRKFTEEYIHYMISRIPDMDLISVMLELESKFSEERIADMKLAVTDLLRMRRDMHERMARFRQHNHIQQAIVNGMPAEKITEVYGSTFVPPHPTESELNK
jgi:transketolase